jgi:hypothetical protein
MILFMVSLDRVAAISARRRLRGTPPPEAGTNPSVGKKAAKHPIEPDQRLIAVFASSLSELGRRVHLFRRLGSSFQDVRATNPEKVFEELARPEGEIRVGLFENAEHPETTAHPCDDKPATFNPSATVIARW